MSEKLCSRSQLIRSSPGVCGPRSISEVRMAPDCAGTCSTRSRLCEYLDTRPPLVSITKLALFRLSSAAWISVSVASITGARLVF